MHRHVRGVGNQAAGRIKHGAGKIQPLFDIDRACGIGEHRSHLFGNRHKKIIKNFEHYRVSFGTNGVSDGPGLGAG